MAIQQYNKMLGFLPLLCGQSFNKSRCKKLLKISISRIHLLKNRRVVQVNQLRRDVAQLLQFGQEESARTRVARLWKEQNLISAYDTIGNYCKLVLPNLANIGGQRSCPVDLMEPLSSLVFAASSCADLPELQDLREILATKYGNDLQSNSYVNEGILGTFSSRGPSEAARQEMLEGIAKEYNLLPRFWPRISSPSEDIPENVEEISVKCLRRSLGDQRGFSFPESNCLRQENEEFGCSPTSARRQDDLNSCGRHVARENDDDPGRPRRVIMSRYRIVGEGEYLDGTLDFSQNARSSTAKRYSVPGEVREFRNGELVQPAGMHGSLEGKALFESANPSLKASNGVSRSCQEAVSVAANGNEAFTLREKQSSYDADKAGEHDFDSDERKASSAFNDGRPHHYKEAKSVKTRGNVSARKIIDPGDATLVLCSPVSGKEETEADSKDSISIFIPKASFPKPPRRPPPPPPVRVASSPSLSVQSPPRVSYERHHRPAPPVRVASSPSLFVQSPPQVSYQRSSTLETRCFEEQRDAHVHPKLPEYDDLVARFAALKLKTLKQ